MEGDGDRIALAAFLGGAALAGGNAVAIRFSNRELDPLWGAGLRFGLAALVFAALMAALRLKPPRGRALRGALLYGAFTFGGAFALAYYALVELHAGFGQVLLALVPLATLLLAVTQRQERLRAGGLIGSALALAGVALMSSASLDGDVPLASILAALGSAFCFAQGAIFVRRFPPVHPVAMNAVGMTTGTILLFGGTVAAGETATLPSDAETWAAIAYLVIAGSALVFLLYLVVLGRWTASRASYEFVLIPFFTIALSAWLDDERLELVLGLGGLLVLAGVYVGALRGGPAADTR
jgi:drug/metabolite transporter (DMT)-like permease